MLDRSLLPVLVSSAVLGLLACDQPQQQGAAPAGSARPASSGSAAASVKALPPMPDAPPIPKAPAGLPEMKTSDDNPLTPAKVHLGKQLFFDKRLSKDGSASCETCHVPEKGWTDGLKLSTKVGGGVNTRHSPTLWNVGYNDLFYWDGRAPTLEKQIEAAWKGQMGAEPGEIARKLNEIPAYRAQFQGVFSEAASTETIVKALAAFVRTIRSGGSPWDRYEAGAKAAVGEDAVRGNAVFRKAGCVTCHVAPLYTDNGFHNTGIGWDKDVKEPDEGRGKISKDDKQKGAFKTPTLRSVDTSGPYFHDGRAATLEEAVELMAAGGVPNPHLDPALKPAKLTDAEKKDLVAFLEALRGAEEPFERPKLPE
jgi:cytochrome c peroxidase